MHRITWIVIILIGESHPAPLSLITTERACLRPRSRCCYRRHRGSHRSNRLLRNKT